MDLVVPRVGRARKGTRDHSEQSGGNIDGLHDICLGVWSMKVTTLSICSGSV